jgi:hypothetical protein
MVRGREKPYQKQVRHAGRQSGANLVLARESHGGVMRIRRAIVPAVLALSVAGSVVAGSALSVAAGHAPSTHTHVVAASSAATHFHD